MKRFVSLVAAMGLFVFASAQQRLEISTDKTTSLVFPFAITHVDRGLRSVLAQQVKEAPTVLLVKAADKDFRETNLSVSTVDGSVYSFAVSFSAKPSAWLFHLPAYRNKTVSSLANGILDNPKTMNGIEDERFGMEARVKGIYVKDDVLYFQTEIRNDSPIDYSIDLFRFFIKDAKKGKRTAVQEIDCTPLYVAGDTALVKAGSFTTAVFAFEKFTIPDAKYLAVQVMEKNGGRHLNLRISNRKLMKARIIN